jgi:hypothetical protein
MVISLISYSIENDKSLFACKPTLSALNPFHYGVTLNGRVDVFIFRVVSALLLLAKNKKIKVVVLIQLIRLAASNQLKHLSYFIESYKTAIAIKGL